MTALFDTGRVLATPDALAALAARSIAPATLLARHVSGDWGDVDAHDRTLNDNARRDGDRILSSYKIDDACTIWIITEHDRSATTLLLPSDY